MVQKRKMIGVVTADVFSDYNNRILSGIYEQCRTLDYDSCVISMTLNTDNDSLLQRGDENIYSLINKKSLDAVIVMLGNLSNLRLRDRLAETIAKLKIPVIAIDSDLGVFETIYAEDTELFEKMTDHLIDEHGCRRIMCLTGFKGLPQSMSRLEGYRRSMEKHGLTVKDDDIIFGDFWVNSSSQLAGELLRGDREMPDAVVCGNDLMAVSLCSSLIKGGVKVPDTVRITGYDGSRDALESEPQITSILPENSLLGARAVCRLHELMTGEKVQPTDLNQGSLILTQSCGCTHNHDLSLKKRSDDYMTEDLYERYYNNSGMLENMMTAANLEVFFHFASGSFYVMNGLENYFLCLNNNWDNIEGEEDDYIRSGYTEKVALRLCYADGKSGYPDKEFRSEHIIPPFISDYVKGPAMYFLLPVHFHDRCFGYSIFTFKDISNALSMVYALWNRNVSTALEFLRVRTKLEAINNRITIASIRDALTGIYNRKGFDRYSEAVFKRAKTERKKLLVIMADLDLLKHINDTYGHIEGDKAISTAATVLNTTCENSEICARIGGDEYAIVGCFDYTDEIIDGYLSYINDYFDRYNSSSGKPYKVGASLGYYCGIPDEDSEFSKYVDIADKRMYANKLERKKYRTD